MQPTEFIRFAKHTQLSEVTGIEPNYFLAWSNDRHISARYLELVTEKLVVIFPDVDKYEVLKGFDLRRQDMDVIRKRQQEVDNFLASQCIKSAAKTEAC